MKKKVTCRYGVKYEVKARGTTGACLRLFELMTRCCCWVCHNKDCKNPRNEVIEDCNKNCKFWTHTPYCERGDN